MGLSVFPFVSPTVLYLRHHRATSGGWTQSSLCTPCFLNYMPVLGDFIPMCTYSSSCRFQVCLRQPPSLRSLASYSVFHITNNLSEFTVSSKTLYQHYVRAVESNIVPIDRLIPDSLPHLRCTFARGKDSRSVKRYHKACVDPSQFPRVHSHWGILCLKGLGYYSPIYRKV